VPPSKEKLAAIGLRPEDFDGEAVAVWPENAGAFRLLRDLQTQWRVGSGGPIGLDYNVLYHKMDRLALTPADYNDLEADMRVMEAAALAAMREKD
jgi:hypothetical protein